MSSISRAELAANPNLTRLLSPEQARVLGITLPPTPTPPSAPSTLKDAFAQLTRPQKARLRGTESKQHAIFVTWLTKHQIPHIHAPTGRKVHDLPPGWPDFSIFRKTPSSTITQCLLIEFKVPGGVLSFEQEYWMKLLDILIVPHAFQAIASTAAFCEIHLPVLNQTKELAL